MSLLFTRQWIEDFGARWNGDPEIVDALAAEHFTAIVALGFSSQTNPIALLDIREGRIIQTGLYSSRRDITPDWDLRASAEQWESWRKSGFSFNSLGVAVSSGKLEFRKGDYRRLLRTPNLVKAFLRFFELL